MHTHLGRSIFLLMVLLLLIMGFILYSNNASMIGAFAHTGPIPTITPLSPLNGLIEFFTGQLEKEDDPETREFLEGKLEIAEYMAATAVEGAKVMATRPADPYNFIRTPVPTGIKITGIFEPPNGFPPETFNLINGWQEKVNGNYIAVIVGAFYKEPMQGILRVEVNEGASNFWLSFKTPEKHGPVEIKSAKNYRLLLEAADGWTIYFDVPSLSFTQSENEVLPTRTPGPPQPVIISTKSVPYP